MSKFFEVVVCTLRPRQGRGEGFRTEVQHTGRIVPERLVDSIHESRPEKEEVDVSWRECREVKVIETMNDYNAAIAAIDRQNKIDSLVKNNVDLGLIDSILHLTGDEKKAAADAIAQKPKRGKPKAATAMTAAQKEEAENENLTEDDIFDPNSDD